MQDVSAFVLAGGRSSRMGKNKALLPIGDRNFLQIALDNARAVCADPVIVGARSIYGSYGPVLEDRVAGCGPLGGIHAALATTSTNLNLILSVDLPLMSSSFLAWLVELAVAASAAFAIVPRADGHLQPLCAVYRRAAYGSVEQALHTGEYKIDHLFELLSARIVPEGEWSKAGFDNGIFRNINTVEEYESLLQRSCAGHAAEKVPNA